MKGQMGGLPNDSVNIAIETHCKLKGGGYATVLNVDAEIVTHDDRMETFFMVSLVTAVFPISHQFTETPVGGPIE